MEDGRRMAEEWADGGWMDGWGDGKKRMGETGIDRGLGAFKMGKIPGEISRARLIEGARNGQARLSLASLSS